MYTYTLQHIKAHVSRPPKYCVFRVCLQLTRSTLFCTMYFRYFFVFLCKHIFLYSIPLSCFPPSQFYFFSLVSVSLCLPQLERNHMFTRVMCYSFGHHTLLEMRMISLNFSIRVSVFSNQTHLLALIIDRNSIY